MKPDEARRALLSRKTALVRTVAGTLDQDGPVSKAGEIEEIDAALQRIQQGTWGRCEACQRAIGRQRLQALPDTRRCAACGCDAERGSRST
jgi:DnaK suppressor protein